MKKIECESCKSVIQLNEYIIKVKNFVIHSNTECVMEFCKQKNITLRNISSFKYTKHNKYIIMLFGINLIAIPITIILLFFSTVFGGCEHSMLLFTILFALIIPGIPSKILGKDNLWYNLWSEYKETM